MKAIKISYEEDFLMAEQILMARDKFKNNPKLDCNAQYYKG